MNRKIKKQWIEALLSGEYKQTKSSLYNRGRYCCLGVLCEIAGDGYWRLVPKEERIDDEPAWKYVHTDGMESNARLPDRLRFDLDLSIAEEYHLIAMNDAGNSFESIARYIKENL